jgi:general secretion pathway protein B
MSYILDALRRAEAQRSRGAVPTLDSPVPDLAGPARSAHRLAPAAGIAAAVVAVMVGAGAWWLLRLAAPAPSVAVVPEPRPAPGLTPQPSSAPAGGLPLPVPMPGPAPGAAPMPSFPASKLAGGAPAELPPPERPSPTERARPPSPAVPGGVAPVPRTSGAPGVASPAERTTPPASPAARPAAPDRPPAAPVMERRDLPPELQRELPPLVVSGTVYSPQREQRLVIVNGELLHEGAQPAPGLVVDEIRRRDAVFRYRDRRFSVGP